MWAVVILFATAWPEARGGDPLGRVRHILGHGVDKCHNTSRVARVHAPRQRRSASYRAAADRCSPALAPGVCRGPSTPNVGHLDAARVLALLVHPDGAEHA
jgi:hypothetical protein